MDLGTDNSYDYNAPQYLDFELIKNGIEDTSADEWFGAFIIMSTCHFFIPVPLYVQTDVVPLPLRQSGLTF